MRKLDPARRQKMLHARQESSAANTERRARRLVVGGWTVYEFDPQNFAVERVDNPNESQRRYYPDMPSALAALYRRLLADQSRDAEDIKGVLEAIDRAEQHLLRALQTRSLE